MNYYTHTAKNGMKFIHLPSNRITSHCIVIINTGTRDELKEEHGIAHFIEHVFFKGTKKRTYLQILNRMEEVGGELNAYTTKEETCVYATFLPQYLERAMELLYDIIFESTFPEKQLEKEKNVINDEINSYKDSPAEMIYDDFEELIFDGHPLSRNILGTAESLRAIDKKMIETFIKRTYNTNQMVVCTAGNFDYEKSFKLFEKYFAQIPENRRTWKRLKFKKFKPQNKTYLKNTFQAHCIIGTLAYSFNHKDRLILHLINNILGGTNSNSRLNMSIRERKGLVYFIESAYNTYCDTGVIYIYFGTDKEKLDKVTEQILIELKKMREVPITESQLKIAKNQFFSQLALSFDNQESLAINLAKSYLVFGKIDNLDTIKKELNKINSDDIIRVTNDIFNEKKLSYLKYI